MVLVSLAIGLQRNANQQLYGIGDLTSIQVMPNYSGPQGPGGGVVVQSSGGQNLSQTLVTPDTIRELAQIPGVVSVIPRDYIYGGTLINYKRLEGYPNIIGVDLLT